MSRRILSIAAALTLSTSLTVTSFAQSATDTTQEAVDQLINTSDLQRIIGNGGELTATEQEIISRYIALFISVETTDNDREVLIRKLLRWQLKRFAFCGVDDLSCSQRQAEQFLISLRQFKSANNDLESTEAIDEKALVTTALDNLLSDSDIDGGQALIVTALSTLLSEGSTDHSAGTKTKARTEPHQPESNLITFELPKDLRPPECSFDNLVLPENTLIAAAGAYGGREIDYQIDDSGHQATQFDVVVNSPDRPVALLFGAYEPSIWRIGWTEGTEIIAAAAVGKHEQRIAGLPSSTPALLGQNHEECPHTYFTNAEVRSINPTAQKIYGQNADSVYISKTGSVLIGQSVDAGTKLVTNSDTAPETFYRKDVPPAREAGLNQLVREGKMRLLSHKDLDDWAKARMAAENEDLPTVIAEDGDNSVLDAYRPGHVHNGYVILEQITIPAGLHGGHSATFFLLEGVPYPKGDLGHSTIYDFNSLGCKGPGGC